MKQTRRACSCGATLNQIDEPSRIALAEAEWDVWHTGEGHSPCEYMEAVQAREDRARLDEEHHREMN